MIIRVVDVETTGIKDPCEMVEIGWTDIRRSPEGSWAIDCGPFSELVRPGMPISFAAMAVHHISEQDVADGVTPDEARMIVDGAEIYCAHNSAFESRFLGDDRRWICTFKAARTFWPDLQSHGNGAIRYERGICLGDDRAAPSHRAGPDTWITAHILLELLQEHDLDALLEVTTKPLLLRHLDFGEHQDRPLADVPWDYLDWIVNKSNMPKDPKREDAVHTARREIARRQAQASRPAEGGEDRQGSLLGAAGEKHAGTKPAAKAVQPAGDQELKGGPISRRAAYLCQDRGFWTFSDTSSTEEAADWLREICGVASRAVLDHDERAAREFDRVDGKYRRWIAGYDD